MANTAVAEALRVIIHSVKANPRVSISKNQPPKTRRAGSTGEGLDVPQPLEQKKKENTTRLRRSISSPAPYLPDQSHEAIVRYFDRSSFEGLVASPLATDPTPTTSPSPHSDLEEKISPLAVDQKTSANSLAALISYVPDVILHCCLQNLIPPLAPRFQRITGAILLLDISGFSSLASQLAKEESLQMGGNASAQTQTDAAAIGAEKMRNVMDLVFATLSLVVSRHGGDLIKLAGDLLIAIWTRASGQSIASVACNAAACAFDANVKLASLKVHDFVILGAHSGIGVGDILCFHVGGVCGKYQFFVTGEAFSQASCVVNQTSKGETAISAEGWDAVSKYFDGDYCFKDGFAPYYLLNALKPNIRILRGNHVSRDVLSEGLLSSGKAKAVISALQAYIPSPVVDSLLSSVKFSATRGNVPVPRAQSTASQPTSRLSTPRAPQRAHTSSNSSVTSTTSITSTSSAAAPPVSHLYPHWNMSSSASLPSSSPQLLASVSSPQLASGVVVSARDLTPPRATGFDRRSVLALAGRPVTSPSTSPIPPPSPLPPLDRRNLAASLAASLNPGSNIAPLLNRVNSTRARARVRPRAATEGSHLLTVDGLPTRGQGLSRLQSHVLFDTGAALRGQLLGSSSSSSMPFDRRSSQLELADAWIGSLRSLSVVFVSILKLDFQASNAFERIQETVFLTQLALYSFEGTLKEFIFDDKGFVVVAAFGIPPLSHDDDALRAVLFAMTLQKELQSVRLDCACGVTTGESYFGVFGSPLRREFCIVGEKVNLSARLMQRGSTLFTDAPIVIVDQATCSLCESHVRFDKLEPIYAKGSTGRMEVFTPSAVLHRRLSQLAARMGSGSYDQLRMTSGGEAVVEGGGQLESGGGGSRLMLDLVGRAAEVAALVRMLQEFKLQGSSGLHVLVGSGGGGKFRVAQEAMRIAEVELALPVVCVECKYEKRSEALHPIYAALTLLFERESPGFSHLLPSERGAILHEFLCFRAPSLVSSLLLASGFIGAEDAIAPVSRTSPTPLPAAGFNGSASSTAAVSAPDSPPAPTPFSVSVPVSVEASPVPSPVLLPTYSLGLAVPQGPMSPLLRLSSRGSLSSFEGELAASVPEVDDQLRTEKQIFFFAKLFDVLTSAAPYLLVFRHAHVMDDLSWRVLERVADSVASIKPLLCLRTDAHLSSSRFRRLYQTPSTQLVTIAPLLNADTLALAAQLLDAEWVAAPVENYILKRCHGNPLFVYETVAALRKSALVHVDAVNRTCHLASGALLEDLPVPKAVAGLLSANIDRLSFAQQTFLRTAAVLGKVFSFDLLAAVLPIKVTRAALVRDAETLIERQFLRSFLVDNNGVSASFFGFLNDSVIEVCYRTLTAKQRQDLHLKVVTVLENFGRGVAARTDAVTEFLNCSVVLFYHHAMAHNDEACAVHLDQAKALNINLKGALRAIGLINFAQVSRAVRKWLFAGAAYRGDWRRCSLSVVDDVCAEMVALGESWAFGRTTSQCKCQRHTQPILAEQYSVKSPNQQCRSGEGADEPLVRGRRTRRRSDVGARLSYDFQRKGDESFERRLEGTSSSSSSSTLIGTATASTIPSVSSTISSVSTIPAASTVSAPSALPPTQPAPSVTVSVRRSRELEISGMRLSPTHVVPLLSPMAHLELPRPRDFSPTLNAADPTSASAAAFASSTSSTSSTYTFSSAHSTISAISPSSLEPALSATSLSDVTPASSSASQPTSRPVSRSSSPNALRALGFAAPRAEAVMHAFPLSAAAALSLLTESIGGGSNVSVSVGSGASVSGTGSVGVASESSLHVTSSRDVSVPPPAEQDALELAFRRNPSGTVLRQASFIMRDDLPRSLPSLSQSKSYTRPRTLLAEIALLSSPPGPGSGSGAGGLGSSPTSPLGGSAFAAGVTRTSSIASSVSRASSILSSSSSVSGSIRELDESVDSDERKAQSQVLTPPSQKVRREYRRNSAFLNSGITLAQMSQTGAAKMGEMSLQGFENAAAPDDHSIFSPSKKSIASNTSGASLHVSGSSSNPALSMNVPDFTFARSATAAQPSRAAVRLPPSRRQAIPASLSATLSPDRRPEQASESQREAERGVERAAGKNRAAGAEAVSPLARAPFPLTESSDFEATSKSSPSPKTNSSPSAKAISSPSLHPFFGSPTLRPFSPPPSMVSAASITDGLSIILSPSSGSSATVLPPVSHGSAVLSSVSRPAVPKLDLAAHLKLQNQRSFVSTSSSPDLATRLVPRASTALARSPYSASPVSDSPPSYSPAPPRRKSQLTATATRPPVPASAPASRVAAVLRRPSSAQLESHPPPPRRVSVSTVRTHRTSASASLSRPESVPTLASTALASTSAAQPPTRTRRTASVSVSDFISTLVARVSSGGSVSGPASGSVGAVSGSGSTRQLPLPVRSQSATLALSSHTRSTPSPTSQRRPASLSGLQAARGGVAALSRGSSTASTASSTSSRCSSSRGSGASSPTSRLESIQDTAVSEADLPEAGRLFAAAFRGRAPRR